MKQTSLWLVIAMSLLTCGAVAQQLPYQNTSLTPDKRADDLLKRLTLEEKVSLMQNASPAIPRLGIKTYQWWNEALHGVGRSGLATVFPQAVGMAASFNDALLFDAFTAVSDEARAKSNKYGESGGLRQYQGLTFWTPNVNIFRDPRWGRGQETYGEDPYLTSRMGVSVVRGLQGPADAPYDKLHACAKHFAVHSGPEWNRHSFNADSIAPRDLWETYLPAFKSLVQEADVKEVMCAYNRFEGEPCCGSNRLLTQILRDQWGFDGVVVSDCWAIADFYKENAHATHKDAKTAAASAVLSGTDLECGSDFRTLTQGVKDGLIEESRVDVSVKRLLVARFELGEMNETNPWPVPYSVLDSKEHKDLAAEMARQSMVLLQNKGNILPLAKNLKIAVMGPNANDSVMQWGNYNGTPSHTVTLLEGVRALLPSAQIIYEPGCDRTTDVAVGNLFNECTSNNAKGFTAQYWNTREQQGEPVATASITTPFQFTTMGATAFAPGVNIRDFSAKYTTTFTPTKTQDVVFQLQAAGRANLLINGQQVSRPNQYNAPTNVYTLKATAGTPYTLEIQFSQGDADASLNFTFGPLVPMELTATINKVKDADVVLFAGGIAPSLEGEEMRVTIPGFKGGDRTDIELPGIQRRMLQALKAAGKKVVFVNFSGSAMGLVPETESCDAILQAWYPGQAGGTAVADVVFGNYNPAGRLPVTFYKNVNQLPDFEDYSMKGRTYRYMTQAPLFSFGYGLSYTQFTFGKAAISSKKIKRGDSVTLTIPVTNTGKRNGEEVVQVYLRKVGDAGGPIKTLRAFKRLPIASGKTASVKLTLKADQLQWFDENTGTVQPTKGQYELLYGSSSNAKDLQTLKLTIL